MVAAAHAQQGASMEALRAAGQLEGGRLLEVAVYLHAARRLPARRSAPSGWPGGKPQCCSLAVRVLSGSVPRLDQPWVNCSLQLQCLRPACHLHSLRQSGLRQADKKGRSSQTRVAGCSAPLQVVCCRKSCASSALDRLPAEQKACLMAKEDESSPHTESRAEPKDLLRQARAV